MAPTVLSSQGLKRIASISENDFEFAGKDFEFIGNTCRLKSTKFQAAFVSPRVHALLLQDTTSNSFLVECTSQKMNEMRVFELLEQLMNGEAINPPDSEVDGLFEVATLLGTLNYSIF
jgi:hypothetical protein